MFRVFILAVSMALGFGIFGSRVSAAEKADSEKFFIAYILPLFTDDLSSLCASADVSSEINILKKLPFGELELILRQVPEVLFHQWGRGDINLSDFHQVPQRYFKLDISVSETQSHYRSQILKEMRKNELSFLKIDAFPESLHINFIVTGAVIKKQLPWFPGKGLIKDEALIESWLQCRFMVNGTRISPLFNSAVVGKLNLTPLFNLSVAPGLSRDFAKNPFLNIPFTMTISEDRFNLTSVNMP